MVSISVYGQNEGIRPWEMRNANGKGYVMVSGIDSVMYYDKLDTYIRDTLGYSRIDSIKCVSDTIRIYTNNGQFKMPFSCSGGGGGGSGDITGVTVTSPITGGGTSGTVNIAIQQSSGSQAGYLSSTDWTTFNNKPSGSGSTAQMAYWFNGTTLTGENRFMYYNSSSRYISGIGYTGGNGTFPDDLESSTNGYIASGTNAGIGLRAGSHIWSIASKSTGDLWFNKKGASWTTNPYMTLSSGGALTVSDLAGSGTRMVVASSAGLLSTQTIPSSGATDLSFSGAASPFTLNSSTGGDVRFFAGSNVTLTKSGNDLTINSTATGTTGLTHYGSAGQSSGSIYPITSTGNGSNAPSVSFNLTTGGNITFNSTSVTIPISGTYQITYSLNASCNSTATGQIMFAGIYINDALVDGSASRSIEQFTQNKNYTFSNTITTALNFNQVLKLKVVLSPMTTNYTIDVSGATLTLKKVN